MLAASRLQDTHKYHSDHLSLGHSFQAELKLMLAHIHFSRRKKEHVLWSQLI